jgi:ArsR family transcriptional regulator
LFRLLGDEDRLRLLALCAEEELTVGELAQLLGESQPQITKKSQPLREVGLLATRRDGTRTLLKAEIDGHAAGHDRVDTTDRDNGANGDARDPATAVIRVALAEGRRLCAKDGSLAKVARVVAQREELSRNLFEQPRTDLPPTTLDASSLAGWLPLLAPLLPGRALAIDAGTGEGELLPLLSPLYERVVAVDRSAARLARCALRIDRWGLANVRLREGSIEDAALAEEIAQRGGADLVVIARVLHHVGRPQDVIASATQLLRSGGHLAIVDYMPHDDESLREQGHVWLGFEPDKLRSWLSASRLAHVVVEPLLQPHHPPLQLAIGKKPARS